MADTRPTPVSPSRAIALCILLLVAPEQLAGEEKKDDELRKTLEPRPAEQHRAHIVRKALFTSLALVLVSALVGFVAAQLMGSLGRCAPTSTVALLQIVGASVLLWGTLFIRGWEIQSLGGVTLTERINQWLYRALYCVGTTLLVYSLAFPACKQ
jgi:hypothetical protein